MSAGDPSQIIRASGRLVVNPTDLGVAFPHGGTEVGRTRAVVVKSLGTSFRVEAEGLGEISDVLESSNRFVFACMLRGWNDDAVRLLWPDNYVVGSVSGHAKLDVPGNSRPGSSTASRAVVLLFAPDDPINCPAVLVFNGIPDWSDNAELAFSRNDELGLPLAVECLRNLAGKTLSIGRLSDLSLT